MAKATQRVRPVGSFAELRATPFAGDVNALCWERTLPGDFAEVIAALGAGNGIVTIDDDRLQALDLSPAGQLAAAALLASTNVGVSKQVPSSACGVLAYGSSSATLAA